MLFFPRIWLVEKQCYNVSNLIRQHDDHKRWSLSEAQDGLNFDSWEKNLIISRQTVNERKLEENCFNVKFAEVE